MCNDVFQATRKSPSLQCMLIHIDYRSSTVDIAFITHHSRTIPSSVSRIYVICLFLKRFVTSQWLEINFSACKKKIKKAKNKEPLNSKRVWKHQTWYSVYLWPTIPKQNILYFYFTLEIYTDISFYRFMFSDQTNTYVIN